MDIETPADTWYVWLGVSIASVAIAGVALGLPTGPPPDANGAANAIDRVAGSPYDASATHEYEAEEVRIVGGKRLELRNEHGAEYASIAYGQVVLVSGDERLENVTHGTSFEDEFENELERGDVDATAAFLERVENAADGNDGEWHAATDDLVVRTLSVEPDDVLSLSVEVREIHGEYDDDEEVSVPTATSLEFQYAGDRELDAELEAYGGRHGEDASIPYSSERDVLFDAGRGSVTWSFDASAENPEHRAIHSPFVVSLTTDEGMYCTTDLSREETRNGDVVDLCAFEEQADEIAHRSDRIEIREEAQRYYVTLIVV